MMERVDQERPGWDGDQFEVLTEEEVAGVGGEVAEGVVEDVMEGGGAVGVGVSGDDAGDGGDDDDQGDNAGTSNDAGASENNDGAGVRAGKEEGEAWGGEEGGESEVIWEGNVSVSCCVLAPPSRPAQRPQTVTRSPCGG